MSVIISAIVPVTVAFSDTLFRSIKMDAYKIQFTDRDRAPDMPMDGGHNLRIGKISQSQR